MNETKIPWYYYIIGGALLGASLWYYLNRSRREEILAGARKAKAEKAATPDEVTTAE